MLKRSIHGYSGRLRINQSKEGEHLETKVERIVTLNEPISDGAPIIYTNRKDGVQPQFNIRTDRFDIAIEAMDKTAKSYKARREEKAEMRAEKGGLSENKGGENDGDVGGAKSIPGES